MLPSQICKTMRSTQTVTLQSNLELLHLPTRFQRMPREENTQSKLLDKISLIHSESSGLTNSHNLSFLWQLTLKSKTTQTETQSLPKSRSEDQTVKLSNQDLPLLTKYRWVSRQEKMPRSQRRWLSSTVKVRLKSNSTFHQKNCLKLLFQSQWALTLDTLKRRVKVHQLHLNTQSLSLKKMTSMLSFIQNLLLAISLLQAFVIKFISRSSTKQAEHQ